MSRCMIHASNNTKSATNDTPFNRAVMHASKVVTAGDTHGFGGALHFTVLGDSVYAAGTDGKRLNLASFPKDGEDVPPGLLGRIGAGNPWFRYVEKRKTSVVLEGRDYGMAFNWPRAIGLDEGSPPGMDAFLAAGHLYAGKVKLCADCLGNFMGEMGRYHNKYLDHRFLMDAVGGSPITVQVFVDGSRLLLLDETHHPDRPLVHCIAFRHNMSLLTIVGGSA